MEDRLRSFPVFVLGNPLHPRSLISQTQKRVGLLQESRSMGGILCVLGLANTFCRFRAIVGWRLRLLPLLQAERDWSSSTGACRSSRFR